MVSSWTTNGKATTAGSSLAFEENVGEDGLSSQSTYEVNIDCLYSPFFFCAHKIDSKKNQKTGPTMDWPQHHFRQTPFQCIAPACPLLQGIWFLLQRNCQFWQRHGVTHIKADAMMLPESALLLHHERIFSGKMLMDHNTKYEHNTTINQKWAAGPAPLAK